MRTPSALLVILKIEVYVTPITLKKVQKTTRYIRRLATGRMYV